jgi:hypothetical protein
MEVNVIDWFWEVEAYCERLRSHFNVERPINKATTGGIDHSPNWLKPYRSGLPNIRP